MWETQSEEGEQWEARRAAERAVGVTHISSRTALRVSSQIIALDRLDPSGLDPRLGDVDAEKLARCPAVIVNIEYPLGLAAYNILRELTVSTDVVRGVYVLGKAATLNADVGDVLISGVIHDEHSGSTYWLDNAFSFDDIAPFLRFGSGLDNQRAVTVKSTFLQNREYLDFYYREAYTVVEMEAGPFCNAVYEIADADRYPGRRGGQLRQAADRLRDHPLRLRHAVHAGAHARRPRPVLLRHGLDLRELAGDHAPGAAAGGPAGALRSSTTTSGGASRRSGRPLVPMPDDT